MVKLPLRMTSVIMVLSNVMVSQAESTTRYLPVPFEAATWQASPSTDSRTGFLPHSS
jgi:hypothetical protein